MQKAILIKQIDMKMFRANMRIENIRKEERFNRLNKEKENPFHILKKCKR